MSEPTKPMKNYTVTLSVSSDDDIESVKKTCEELTDPLNTPDNITVSEVRVEEVK